MKDSTRFRLPGFVLVTFATTMLPVPAEAHLNSTGMGPVYDGLIHFVTSPEDLVPVLALAMLAGLRGANFGRRALFVLPAAWLLGGVFGIGAPAATNNTLVTAAGLLLLGGLLSLGANVSLRGTTVLAALLGLHHGYLNGTGMGEAGTAVSTVFGLGLGVFALVALAAAFVVPLRASWARVAVRVEGSWIAASGLLTLAWAVRAR